MNVFIPENQMRSEFVRVLMNTGFSKEKAEKCSDIFTLNSIEGVYSHGVNRFPRFVENVRKGYILPDAEPTLIINTGSLEQWDGNSGPGPLNASFATERVMTIASSNGIGLVSLADTNHWMRGGTYGWQAAKKGFAFIGWTNTEANMPAWGARDPRLGNNPLVFAVPFQEEAIVLDFAMSQFSYGKMEMYKLENKQLPYQGGYDRNGNLSADPVEILFTRRTLPVGFWKGSGLSLLLDILATVISGGFSTHEISRKGAETGLSQVFIAVSLTNLSNANATETSIRNIIENIKESVLVNPENGIRYPGENVIRIREENRKSGIPVNQQVWEEICSL